MSDDGIQFFDEQSANSLKLYFRSVFTSYDHDNINSSSRLSPSTHERHWNNLFGNFKLNRKDTAIIEFGRQKNEIQTTEKHQIKFISFSIIIFQQSLSSNQLPTDWKVGRVVSIYKSGDRTSQSNYLPSVPCKLLGDVIYSKVMMHVENNHLFLQIRMSSVNHFSVKLNRYSSSIKYTVTSIISDKLTPYLLTF